MSKRYHKHQENKYTAKKRFAQAHTLSPQTLAGEKTKPQKEKMIKEESELENSLDEVRKKITLLEKSNSKLKNLICQLCIGIWRVQQKMIPNGTLEPIVEMKKAYRPVETMKDLLSQNGFVIKDLTGLPYIDGMTLNVIAWPQTDGIDQKIIIETIKPIVKFENQILERGEVIVGVPEENGKALPNEKALKDFQGQRFFKKLSKKKDI